MEPPTAFCNYKHDVRARLPLLLACLPTYLPTRDAMSVAHADGVKNRFPLHFMAKAEWNGMDWPDAEERTACGASEQANGRWFFTVDGRMSFRC